MCREYETGECSVLNKTYVSSFQSTRIFLKRRQKVKRSQWWWLWWRWMTLRNQCFLTQQGSYVYEYTL